MDGVISPWNRCFVKVTHEVDLGPENGEFSKTTFVLTLVESWKGRHPKLAFGLPRCYVKFAHHLTLQVTAGPMSLKMGKEIFGGLFKHQTWRHSRSWRVSYLMGLNIPEPGAI